MVWFLQSAFLSHLVRTLWRLQARKRQRCIRISDDAVFQYSDIRCYSYGMNARIQRLRKYVSKKILEERYRLRISDDAVFDYGHIRCYSYSMNMQKYS